MNDAAALVSEELAIDYDDGTARFLFTRLKPGHLPYISFEGPHQEEPTPSLARLMAASRVYSIVRDYCVHAGDDTSLQRLAANDETLRKIIAPALTLRGKP